MRRALALAATFAALVFSVACGSPALAPADLHQQSLEKIKQQQTYHLDGKIDLSIKDASSLSMSMTMNMDGDAQMPDKFRGKVSATVFGQAIAQEVVTVGGRSWSRPAGGTWTEAKSAGNASSTGVFVDSKVVKDLKELAQETIDGKAMRHLVMSFDFDALAKSDPSTADSFKQLASSGFDPSALNLTLDEWIDAQTSLPRRQKLAMDGAAKAGSFSMTFLIDYSKIGEAVQPPIEAPR